MYKITSGSAPREKLVDGCTKVQKYKSTKCTKVPGKLQEGSLWMDVQGFLRRMWMMGKGWHCLPLLGKTEETEVSKLFKELNKM